MNPEERLPDALHATLDAAQPSPDLEDRIVERVAVVGRRTVRSNVRFGFTGMAALLLVVALVAVAVGLRSNGGPGSAGSSATLAKPVPTYVPTASSSPAPAGSLAHFDRDGLAFDYPASWKTSVSGLNMHYITILDFLGTGSGLATCTAITPGPSDKFISSEECGANLTVGAGQVMVELSRGDGPGQRGPIDSSDLNALSAGQRYVTVGGLPAIFEDQGATLDWTLSVPGDINSRYIIHVEMKSPGTDQMRAQVEALVASISYDPPVPVLDPADGPRIAAIGLAQASAKDSSLACFPSVPGATATATVLQLPGYSILQALPVICETEIEPVPIGLWKLTLTESWTAASDRAAGSLTTTIWLAPDGTPGETEGGPAPSGIPYFQ
jgi:hypothetical protein